MTHSMTSPSLGRALLLAASTALMSGLFASPAMAQDVDDAVLDDPIDEIITIGTRRQSRSAADSLAPIDILSATELLNQGSNDVVELLRTSVPSFNVNTQPISDAATIIRPANLRALSPDNTLVLLNGKRRTRGSVISFLGGGISDGAQPVDVSVFPALALRQVEVLRDGASSQYGSDAIAGVINFELKNDAQGGAFEVEYGSTYDGDGDFVAVSGNIGLPLGDKGFVNLTAEYGEVDGTVRSVVRSDVAALIAAGNTAAADFETINTFTDEVPQYWGQPDVTDNFKFFVNTGLELTPNVEVYAFGNFAQRTVEGGFFYRNPTNRGGVYAGPEVDPATGALLEGGVASVLVGDLDGVGVGEACPAGIPLTGTDGLIPDPTILGQVQASANCFSFVETIPGGFVPRFGGDNEDWSVAGGVRGDIDIGTGLAYDVSVVHGSNETEFFIENTVNASLGPNTPRDFTPGAYEQTEIIADANFVYNVPVSSLASDVSVGFGAQYRKEEFVITQGDDASFALGPLADQGFSSSSNGFGGFSSSSTSDQDSYGVYLDVEADVTEALTLQGALRYEDYTEFGDTVDYKVAARYEFTPSFAIRGAASTGFHAPTAGQANVTNVTTQNVNGVLIDQGTIPLSSSPGQLAAAFIEDRDGTAPDLSTEESQNFSVGTVFDVLGVNVTLDYFNIDVDDRIALSENVVFLDALNFAAAGAGLAAFDNVSTALTGLANAGAIVRSDFVGFEDLTEYRYFTNSFDTTTQGVEVVATLPLDITTNGVTNITLAGAYIDTEVDDPGDINPIGEGRILALEELLPELKGAATITHREGPVRGLIRANYFGEWNDAGNGNGNQGAEIFIDAELGLEVIEGVEFIAGAENIFDNFPDVNPDATALGQLYPEASPGGFRGGSYYFKARYTF